MQENIMTDWLHRRRISDVVISEFNVHWGEHNKMGECIVLPVHDEQGQVLFRKYRRSPLVETGEKYVYEVGGKVSLYGSFKAKHAKRVLITEGELDTLVAWSYHIPAVSSTGGAISFQKDWAPFFKDKEVIACYDNDEAGGKGLVKVLKIVPHAKILFLPDRPGIKDISDYVQSGGDLPELMKTAVRFGSLQDIIDHRSERLSTWQSTYFHDAYIFEHEHQAQEFPKAKREEVSDEIARAKSYPIHELVEFSKLKACCLWHKEKTASMHYFVKNNRVYCFGCGKGGDAIDVYKQLHGCSFKEAVSKLQ